MRLIDADELKQRILKVRDSIPAELPAAYYELRATKPNNQGNAMRGGIRKALHCMEMCHTIDAVEVVRCKECIHRPVWRSCQGKREDDFCSYGERSDND